MHHYRSKNVYISSTASKRIVDTLELCPLNLPMPQISSTDRLLMAANDMTDALKHPHHDVPFTTIGDDKITALGSSANKKNQKQFTEAFSPGNQTSTN
jgi:hypothetical protein